MELKNLTCSHGHPLNKKNLTSDGKCKICDRNIKKHSGTANKEKVFCLHGHLLSGDNVKIYLDSHGKARRRCNQCHAERARAYYYNKIKPAKQHSNSVGRPRKY